MSTLAAPVCLAHGASGLASEFHRWPLPAYLWPALERLYHSIFCSEPHLRCYDSLCRSTEAWVARERGQIAAIVLFEIRGRVACVLNQTIVLPVQWLDAFAQALFDARPALHLIRVQAVHTDAAASARTAWAVPFSEDYVLTLPSTADAWRAQLSAQTREKLRYHLRRSQRKQPGLRFRLLMADQITDAAMEAVIALNRARMQAKGQRFGLDAHDQHCLMAVMKERGQLALMEIDGVIGAGLLCTRAGADLFMHVIAHDPRHDDLRLGFLCCALTIEAAIGQQLQRFHFLWGRYDYKTRLGGQRRALFHVLLPRHRWQLVLHPRITLAHARDALRARWRQRHMT